MPDEPEKKSGQEPNLELPSLLGFGRKKKKGKTGSGADKAAPDEAVTADSVTADSVTEKPVVPEPAVDSDDPRAADPVPQPKSGLAPATHRAKRPPPVPPPPATRQEPEVVSEPEVRQEPEVVPAPEAAPEPEVRQEPEVVPEPEAVPEPEVRQEPEVAPEPAVLPQAEVRQEPEVVPEPAVVPEPEPERRPRRWFARRDTEETEVIETVPPEQPVAATAAEPVTEPPPTVPSDPPAARRADGPIHEGQVSWADEDPVSEPVNEPVEEPVAAGARRARAPRTSPTLPVINPRLAAALTGGVVGLVGVALTSVAASGCEVIRGVGSCGGIGLLALLVILALEIMLGAVLLKAWRLSDPTSTSFLGVGLAAVFVLLFLLSSLESVWMFLVIPLLTVATFVLSWLITETFTETALDDLHR